MNGKLSWLLELATQGYSNRVKNISQFINRHPEYLNHIARFTSGITRISKGSTRYSSLDLFGETVILYFNVHMKFEVGKHLGSLFLKNNPNPNPGLRSAFTRLLHGYGLHWTQCCSHLRRDRV